MLALMVSFASPASAAAESFGQTRWWVRARQAVERRFSLTSELVYERQESLRIAAFDQFLQVVDLQTGEEHSGRLPGDPALLGRKFDLRFERQSAGPGWSVALPTLGLVYPTLTISAADAEVTLDFHDVTESRDSTSLRGRGALFDSRVDVVAAPCRRCPWFTATGYRFEKLPSLGVDRSPRFEIQGFSISKDDVQLGREVHEISSRVGYAPPGSRVVSFVGVQHRWTELDIDDRIAYRDSTSETRLSSRTRLESEATLAVAGVDVELGSRWSGRLETAVGDEDSSAWIGFAFQPSSSGRPTERIRNARLAREIARLQTELPQDVASLPQVGWVAAAQNLLDRYEKRLLDLLPLPEFAALQSLVRYRFEQARNQLLSAASHREAPSSPDGVHPGYVPTALDPPARAASRSNDNLEAFESIRELLGRLRHLIATDDLDLTLCVQATVPEVVSVYLIPSGYFAIDPNNVTSESNLEGAVTISANKRRRIDRGHFGYFLWGKAPNHELGKCTGSGSCSLDLANDDYPYVVCSATTCEVRAPEDALECD